MNEYLKNKAYQIKEFDSLLNSKIPLTTNEKKSFWIYRINQKKLPKNGFKIHISANINNAKNIAEIFFSYIDKYELNYKIVSSLQNLEKQNFGINGYSQVGKFITIYPVNKIQLQKTLFDLEILYKNFKSPNIPSDFSYMNSEVVYYRYGEFIINDEFKDRRDKKIPSKLRVPILDYTIPRYNQIPSKYIILEVIKKNFKGGIYKVFNTEKLNISILKEGSFQGNMDVYNVDSMNRVYWELLILKELKSESFSPNLLNYFYIGRSLFIEIEYIEGKTFKEILDISKQFSTERFILILNILVKLNTKYSISFRDISFENIIFNQEGSVKFIDFEYCYKMSDDINLPFTISGTPGFYNFNAQLENISKTDIYSFASLLFWTENYRLYKETFNLSYYDSLKKYELMMYQKIWRNINSSFSELYDKSFLNQYERIEDLEYDFRNILKKGNILNINLNKGDLYE